MRIEEIPQDQRNFYEGHRRAVYAVDAQGRHVIAGQSGWEVETFCTDLAWRDVSRRVGVAMDLLAKGKRSPLAVHAEVRMVGVGVVSAETGLSWWRVWLDMRPFGYRRMTDDRRVRYEKALGIRLGGLDDVTVHADVAALAQEASV